MFPYPVSAPVAIAPITSTWNSPVHTGVVAASHTFTDAAIGTAATTRRVLVGASGNFATSTLTGTVGGVAITTVVTLLGTAGQAAWLGIATVPSGTTGDVVVNHGSTGSIVCGVWSLYGASDTASDTATSTASSPTGTLDVPVGGFAIGIASSGNSSNVTYVWSGATERYDSISGQNYINGSGADVDVSAGDSSLTLTATYTGGIGHAAGVFAAFGPV